MKVVVRKRTVGNIPLLEVVAEDKICLLYTSDAADE